MDKWKNQDRLGSIYVFLMIFCFKISGNKNQELKKEIEILRSDSEARFNYEYFSTSEEIEKLLSIQKEQPMKKTKKIQAEDLKKKIDFKKTKLRQKYQQNNANIMMKLSRTHTVKEDTEICLTCHEKSR